MNCSIKITWIRLYGCVNAELSRPDFTSSTPKWERKLYSNYTLILHQTHKLVPILLVRV
jgi:hypothetical protein